MKHEKSPSGLKLAIPFFCVLTVLTIVSFLLPLRPTQSQMEKRNLAQFPEYSWDALVSGSYFDDISLWFSDTFPGREGWLRLSTSIQSLHGYSEIAFTSDIDLSEPVKPIPVVTEPAQEVPETQAPFSLEDQPQPATEPTQAQWGGVDAGDDQQIELGGGALIQIGDAVFNQVGFAEVYGKKYAGTISSFADNMAEKGIRVISAPAPTAVGILVEPQYLEKLNCADQNATIQFLHSNMGENVIKVDTYAALIEHNDEYIYFRTDHHWSALGAYYVYEAVCQAAGYEPAALEDFEIWDQGEFEGSLFWRAPYPQKLRRDQVYAYIPEGDIDVVVHDSNGGFKNSQLLFDTTNRELNTKYLIFLGTDYAMTEITNNSLPDGPTCILVKDSFGNAICPFFTQNYHKIYAIDYRKYTANLNWLVQTMDVDDVILSPYVIATQAIDGNDLFELLVG